MPNDTIPNRVALQEAIDDLNQRYNSTYKSPEALSALAKTIKTFNITIKDWNDLITYISNVGLTLEALYNVAPELATAVEATYHETVTGGFVLSDVLINMQ